MRNRTKSVIVLTLVFVFLAFTFLWLMASKKDTESETEYKELSYDGIITNIVTSYTYKHRTTFTIEIENAKINLTMLGLYSYQKGDIVKISFTKIIKFNKKTEMRETSIKKVIMDNVFEFKVIVKDSDLLKLD